MEYAQIENLIKSLKKMTEKNVYLISLAICPNSTANLPKDALIDNIGDVLRSRL